jgi:hypothetical protein
VFKLTAEKDISHHTLPQIPLVIQDTHLRMIAFGDVFTDFVCTYIFGLHPAADKKRHHNSRKKIGTGYLAIQIFLL